MAVHFPVNQNELDANIDWSVWRKLHWMLFVDFGFTEIDLRANGQELAFYETGQGPLRCCSGRKHTCCSTTCLFGYLLLLCHVCWFAESICDDGWCGRRFNRLRTPSPPPPPHSWQVFCAVNTPFAIMSAVKNDITDAYIHVTSKST